MHRKLKDHPRYHDSEWVHVWLHILMSVTHKPRRVDFEGRIVELQPGQMVTGRHAIAAATGVLESKVKRLLAVMKTDQQIGQQAGAKGSIITVLNWQSYQNNGQRVDSAWTATGH